MAVTALQYMDRLRWVFMECGRQVEWNRLYQILASEAGSDVTGGTTVLTTVDLVDGTGTGIQHTTATPPSGPFTTTGSEATVDGEKVIPADPGGHYSPTPERISMDLPMAGFRTF